MGAPAVASPRAPQPRPAPSRRAPGRRAPARSVTRTRRRSSGAAAVRRPNPALAGAAMIPSAAVRTAGAVRDLSDSSLIVRLTRGRAWIAVLSALLGGIVALNVISLSLNAGSGQISQQISELERSNSALRAEFAERLSASEVEAAAATLGLATPDPEDITYLTSSDSDADKLARLLRNETVLTDSVAEPVPTASATPSATGYAEAETVAPSPEPVTPQPAPAPASTAPTPTPSGGTSGGVGL